MKLHNLKSSNQLLHESLLNGVIPKWLLFRIKRSKLKHSSSIEGIFLKNEICKNEALLVKLHANYKTQFDDVYENLSFTDFIALMKYITFLCKRTDMNHKKKNQQTLNWLRSCRYGSVKKQQINNLSSYQLTENEQLALSFGLNFSLPAAKVNREEVITSFEMFHEQIKKHKPVSNAELKVFKSSLGALAHRYTRGNSEPNPCVPVKDLRRSISELKRNDSIIITKPDKGSGVVILDKEEYYQKMLSIVQDVSKFQYIGPAQTADKTGKREDELRKFLVELEERKEITEAVKNLIRPVGSQRPRLYGLPKTHKVGTPLRPILSMIGSPQHNLAKYLNGLLQPVVTKYSRYTIRDSFEFAKVIREVSCSNTFMASFDVKSLFTNVPLMETINICADALFQDNNLTLTRSSFIELMQLATSSTEFSIMDEMYRQVDGVAMGSPLGPTLANIFVGFLEAKYFQSRNKPKIYYRYVDDCFIIFDSKDECMSMFQDFNRLHGSIEFTMESEVDNCLPFLDVLVERTTKEFITSVYRKPTFTGQYINFLSHCSNKRKVNLIKTLCHRAITICSPSTVEDELEKITQILKGNGYPQNLVVRTIECYRDKLTTQRVYGPVKCPVPIKLPFLGSTSSKYERELKVLTRQCFYAVEPRIIFTSKPIFSHVHKDRIPMKDNSLVIYQFQCSCEKNYVGKTKRRLVDRMKEHIPPCVTKHYSQTPDDDYMKNIKLVRAAAKSSVSQHLLESKECGRQLKECNFNIIKKCRSSFEMDVYETVYIASKEPSLCKQREFDFVTCFI